MYSIVCSIIFRCTYAFCPTLPLFLYFSLFQTLHHTFLLHQTLIICHHRVTLHPLISPHHLTSPLCPNHKYLSLLFHNILQIFIPCSLELNVAFVNPKSYGYYFLDVSITPSTYKQDLTFGLLWPTLLSKLLIVSCYQMPLTIIFHGSQ